MTGIREGDEREQMEKGSEGKKVMGGSSIGKQKRERGVKVGSTRAFWKVKFE